MKFRKNLEAVFLAAACVGTFASYATADVPAPRTLARVQVSAPVADASMPVVVVTGRRMSAAEKARPD